MFGRFGGGASFGCFGFGFGFGLGLGLGFAFGLFGCDFGFGFGFAAEGFGALFEDFEIGGR